MVSGDFSLFLRPFISDEMYFEKDPSGYQDMTPTVAMGRNVIAIGSPHEKRSPHYYVNVAELSFADDNWQVAVEKMIGGASRIFILCGTEHWVHWEIDKICELDCIKKRFF